jgi:hypothetical protein
VYAGLVPGGPVSPAAAWCRRHHRMAFRPMRRSLPINHARRLFSLQLTSSRWSGLMQEVSRQV